MNKIFEPGQDVPDYIMRPKKKNQYSVFTRATFMDFCLASPTDKCVSGDGYELRGLFGYEVIRIGGVNKNMIFDCGNIVLNSESIFDEFFRKLRDGLALQSADSSWWYEDE